MHYKEVFHSSCIGFMEYLGWKVPQCVYSLQLKDIKVPMHVYVRKTETTLNFTQVDVTLAVTSLTIIINELE